MAAWIDECFDWFDARFAPVARPVLPTRAFFTAPKGQSEATARALLSDVARLLDVERPIEMFPLAKLPAEYRHNYQSLSEVSGTFQSIEGRAVVSYDPEQMARPIHFINTLAHEVMHVKLEGAVSELPGGEETHELTTDLGCIAFGFGIFQLQTADDSGWSGYLSQPSRAYALARFLERRALGPEVVLPHLSMRCAKLLRSAIKSLA